MKNFKLLLSLVLGTLLIVGCNSNDENCTDVDNAEYNKYIIEYLQHKYDVKAEVEVSQKEKLSKEAIGCIENYYKFVSSLKQKPKEMVLKEKASGESMATRTVFCTQTLVYEMDDIIAFVCYEIDGNGKVADNPNIVSGLAGNGVSNNYNCAIYKVDNYRSVCHASGNTIYADVLRGDYMVMVYQHFNNGHPDTTSGISARIIVKLAAYGTVDVPSNRGSFTLHYAGEGSWARDEMELDPLN